MGWGLVTSVLMSKWDPSALELLEKLELYGSIRLVVFTSIIED